MQFTTAVLFIAAAASSATAVTMSNIHFSSSGDSGFWLYQIDGVQCNPLYLTPFPGGAIKGASQPPPSACNGFEVQSGWSAGNAPGSGFTVFGAKQVATGQVWFAGVSDAEVQGGRSVTKVMNV